VDDQYCSATGFCEPQWAFAAWWLFLVLGILAVLAYGRFRARRLEHLAAGLGLAPNQRVVWLRGGSTAHATWLVIGTSAASIATFVAVGVLTRSVAIGLDSLIVPWGAAFGIVMLLDLKWLLTLQPTPEDIEPLDPPE
jgi:hypothetical protein